MALSGVQKGIIALIVILIAGAAIGVGLYFGIRALRAAQATGATGSTGSGGGGGGLTQTIKSFVIPAGQVCTVNTYTNFSTYSSAWTFGVTIPTNSAILGVSSTFADGNLVLASANEFNTTGGGVSLFYYYYNAGIRVINLLYPQNFRGGTLPNNLVDANNRTRYPVTVLYI